MPAYHPSELHQLFATAVNAKDPAALLALYEPDGVAVGMDGETHSGEPALRAMVDGLLASIKHIEGETRRVVLADDLALTSASFRGEFVAPDGTVHPGGGTSAELARRQPDGSWRFVIDDPTFGSD